MPVIECHLLEGYSAEARQRLGEALTDATRMVVPAAAEQVTVMIHEMSVSNYYRGRTTRVGAAELPDAKAIVHEFLEALGQRNLDRARELTADGFTMFFPATGAMHEFDELLQWSGTRYKSIKKTISGTEALQSEGKETVVYCRGTLSGVWIDGSTFDGVRFIDRFELLEGRIIKQEVWNDLAEVRGGIR